MLNGALDGYDSETERPFKMVGDIVLDVYVPPSSPGLPWALEAPYPSRATIQDVLSNYDAHQRPFYAFPTHSTSLRPVLDYLQPPPSHPPGINPIVQPAATPLQPPNHPRIHYCMPPIEADAYEIGRAIHNSSIMHALWQPTPTYRWHEYGPQDRIPNIESSWEYMGHSEDGCSRWREPLPDHTLPLSRPIEYREDPIPFMEDEELPDVPDDTKEAHTSTISERIMNEVPQNLADLTVVQVPDPNDRFSRPVPRYVIPERHEEELERLGRIAADLARDVRRGQRARHRFPPQFAAPCRPLTSPPCSDEDLDLAARDDRRTTYYSFSDDSNDEGSSTGEDPAAQDSSEEEDYIPPARPLETGDSYFPLMPREQTASTDSMPKLQSVSSSRDSLVSSSEESISTTSSDDVILYDAELQYLPSPVPYLEDEQRLPSPSEFFLESPPDSPGALQNLPGTSPIPRPTLAHYAQAAISTAEKALKGLQSTLMVTSGAGSRVTEELETQTRDLERILSITPTPQYLQDTAPRAPLDEDFEERMTASDRVAHLLANALGEPQVYHVQIEPPSINPALLLTTLDLTDIAEKVKNGFKSTPNFSISETPCPSPIYSPTFANLTSGNEHDSCLTSEEQQMMEDIFNFLSDDGSSSIAAPSSISISDLEAAETLTTMKRPSGRRGHPFDKSPPAYDGLEDMFALDMEEAPSEPKRPSWDDFRAMETVLEPPYGAPPSRRPTRNDCGIVTYNRRQFGWHDFQYGIPAWPRAQRERSEAIGYALEFPDRFVLFSRVKLGKRLFPNLQLQRFRHTDRRLRLESAQRARRHPIAPHYDQRLPPDEYPDARRHPRLPDCDPELPEFILNDLGDDSDTDSEASLPDELPVELVNVNDITDISFPFLRFYARLQAEHAMRTTLTPVSRSSRYTPSLVVTPPMPMDYLHPNELPVPKRRKTLAHEIPLAQRVVRAEAFNATLRYWHEHVEELQSMRSDIAFTIQRLIEVIEWLGLQTEFRRIFFPFEESFPITTVFQMYAMERMNNPDGFFRRNPYHLNSILHDSECNFLHACAILFRQTGDYELAYTIEEVVSTRFRDDTGVMHLLREGFIDCHYEITAAFFNDGYGRITDRLAEVAEDYPCGEREFR
ncbi:hypothetical protein FB451DRAFT_1414809 [Mycena latifolia]|nr:hypothetical protein FB451DRAFT_1414809 [Mycena latifolia]